MTDDVQGIVWTVAALIAGALSGNLVYRAGYFHVTLHYFHLPSSCPAAFHNPKARFLLFYTVPALMLIASVWMMPNWIFAAAVVLYVCYRLRSGAWSKIHEVADELTQQCNKDVASFRRPHIPIRRTSDSKTRDYPQTPPFRYYLGQPAFTGSLETRWYCPTNQLDRFVAVLSEISDPFHVRHKLSHEYIAIAATMRHMGIDFSVLCSHSDLIDDVIWRASRNLRLVRERKFPLDLLPNDFTWIRDLYTLLPGQTLISRRLTNSGSKAGVRVLRASSSPFGEGGRVLCAAHTAIVCDRTVNEDGTSHESDIGVFTSIGMRVGRLKNWVARIITPSGATCQLGVNDHNDLNCALLSAPDRSLHLLVDPSIQFAHWTSDRQWHECTMRESAAHVDAVCKQLNITVHRPTQITVPFALNLEQFPDGRVLMTGGDDCVAQAVRDIVGSENIFVTPVPIRFFPVWLKGGIRCLTNRMLPPTVWS